MYLYSLKNARISYRRAYARRRRRRGEEDVVDQQPAQHTLEGPEPRDDVQDGTGDGNHEVGQQAEMN